MLKLHKSSGILPNHQDHLVLSICVLQFFPLTSCPVLFWSLVSSMFSCQISHLCDWSPHPNVFHLCLLVFFYHMYTKCVFLPFCARSPHFTWVFQHFPLKNLLLFDLISGFALQVWLWSCTSTWILPSWFTDFGLNRKTMIYSNTHPVPVCSSLRVLSLIENTLKQLWRKNLWGDHKSQSKWQFPSEVCEASVLSCKKSVLVPWKVLQLLEWCLKCLPRMCSALTQEQ